MRKYLYSIFVILLHVSCENMETVVDLDVPETPPVLVLNGVLDTDRSIQLLISHSVGAFSQEVPNCIEDADVFLFETDVLIDTLIVNFDSTIYYHFYNDGYLDSIPMHYYQSDIIPNNDTNYKIEVNHSNYPSIFATTYIPNDIDVVWDVDTISNEDIIGFNFSFFDNLMQDNYYRLKLYSSCSKEWEEDGELLSYNFNGYMEMMSNDPSFPQNLPLDGYTFSDNQVVFSDALFNGQEKTIHLDIDPGFRYYNCDTIRLEFSVFSQDTYSYYNSLENHRDEGPLNIFGGEVVPVYSNVNNGLGSLISVNAQMITIKP